MITQYNILKIICYISGNTNIIAGFTVLCQCNLPFLQLEFGNFIGTSSGKHKTIMLSYGDSPVIININKITETDFFFSVCYFLSTPLISTVAMSPNLYFSFASNLNAKLHNFRQILVVQLSQIFLMRQLYIILIHNGIVQCCVNAYMTK